MDLWIVLVIILVAVIVWRGPKTLPQLGKAFGRGVKEAREEAAKAQTEIQARTTTDPEDRVAAAPEAPPAPPAPMPGTTPAPPAPPAPMPATTPAPPVAPPADEPSSDHTPPGTV